MKRPAKVGDVGELTFTATTEHAIDFADDRMPAVLSTPWLIWFLEHAARNAMLPLLDDGESTVGTHVDVASSSDVGSSSPTVSWALTAQIANVLGHQ